ncbi:protein-O-mannosyltransferase-like protein [Jatrophihabitans sp. GAS493]|uniref:phospholipid carrier-dependent glycosyltransferase n=1 Tax=Jatrophihabitans sp. GAS493 TaxID=1907575 RepID=UPI000BB94832|nr:phospholipid carrier-dependent glycosyltransferase [Jatrophihabitans sp. GAS493]SOD74765.1 protein-O-mannosyltransferase-like protein [Jatrophihabitans sp. GAS493]
MSPNPASARVPTKARVKSSSKASADDATVDPRGSDGSKTTGSGSLARVQGWGRDRLTHRPELVILTLFALITRLVGVTKPAAVVFDEVYFKTAAGDYRTHQYFFDPHPPLSKLLISLWSWVAGQNPNVVASSTEADTAVRYLPAFAGAMLVPIVWIILRQLKASRRVAALGATAVLLDNALIVESRFVLTDSMLVAFGVGAIAAYLATRTRTGWRFWAFVVLAALLGGAAFATKWTGATALALIALIWLYDVVVKFYGDVIRAKRGIDRSWWRVAGVAAIFLVLPPLLYFAAFWIHFALLTHTGPGDAYMSARFQRTLIGNPNYDPNYHMTFWGKFWDTYHASTLYEKEVTKIGHPYGSRWNQWPLMNRSIYYWAGPSVGGEQGNIYLIGNPMVWWGAVIGMIAVASNMLFQLRRFAGYIFALCLLGVGYLANWLPFERIHRVMFLYHYLFALLYSIMFAVLGLGVLMNWNRESDEHFWSNWEWKRDWLYVTIFVVMLLGFLFIAPLTYGWQLSSGGLDLRMLLNKWR